MEKRLEEIEVGKKAKIIGSNGGKAIEEKMSCLGLYPGKEVEIISKQPFKGPITVKIFNLSFAIGRGIASKINVEEI